MRKKTKKLVLSKETILPLVDRGTKDVLGGAITMSLCAKVCDTYWDCSATSCNIRCQH